MTFIHAHTCMYLLPGIPEANVYPFSYIREYARAVVLVLLCVVRLFVRVPHGIVLSLLTSGRLLLTMSHHY